MAVNENNKHDISKHVEGALRPLEERLCEMNMVFPRKLRKLLTEARSLFGKDDASDKDLRSFIYREMFNFLARENEIGEGLSLVYPPEIVDTIRRLYPEDVKNYIPKSGKRRNFYEAPLKELVEVYREGNLRSGESQSESHKRTKTDHTHN